MYVLKYSFSILLFSNTLGGKIQVEQNQFFEFPTFKMCNENNFVYSFET